MDAKGKYYDAISQGMDECSTRCRVCTVIGNVKCHALFSPGIRDNTTQHNTTHPVRILLVDSDGSDAKTASLGSMQGSQ